MNSDNFPRFRLLGSLRVVHNGHEVDFPGDRYKRMLIALLAAKGEPLSREALTQWIWDVPGDSAETMLQELMGNLRIRLKDIGLPRALVAEHGLCRLEVPVDAVDLHRWRKLVDTARAGDDEHAAELLRQALALFEGEPFGPLCGERIENFRTTLVDERMSARLEYAEVSLRLGQETQILPEIAELSRADPFQEKVAGLLMRAHYQNNDPNRAGDVFRHIRQQLAEHLGTDVGKELAELNDRIIAQDQKLLPARREKNQNRSGSNMANEDASGQDAPEVYTTGTKTALGGGAYAAENAVINTAHSSTPAWPGEGAKEVHTGDKIAIDGGRAFENAVFNGYPE